MASNKGLIVYFDGPDGVGKTEQLKLAAEALRIKSLDVCETRSVGGTPIGELLRQASLSDNQRPVGTDLHIALACQHALAVDVLERRQNGQIVLIDRSPLSIIAYQVAGDGLDPDRGYAAADELLGLVEPDLIIVYTAGPATLEERRHRRNHQAGFDYFENKASDYHQKTAEGFVAAASHFGASVLDAEAAADKIQAETMALIEAKLRS